MDSIAHGVAKSQTLMSNFHDVTIICFNTSSIMIDQQKIIEFFITTTTI